MLAQRDEHLLILPSSLRPLLRSNLSLVIMATILCVASYHNALHGELVHDDIFAIRDNADIRPSTPVTQLWVNDFWGESMSSPTSHKSYRPITVLTFRLNYLLHELESFGYHLVNLVLHIIATLLLGCVCRCVLWREGEGTFMVMSLFAVHPIHTEAVTGIVGRADVLACVLFFLCLLLYWSHIHTLQGWSKSLKLAGCLATGAAAMLSKEHGGTVFGVCLAVELLVVSRGPLERLLTSKQLSLFTSDLRPLTFRCIALILTTCLLLAARVWMLNGQLPSFGRQDNPASFSESILTRGMTYSYLLSFNAKLLLYPAVMCFDYQMGSIPLVESLADPRNLASTIFYLIITCLLIHSLYWNDYVTLVGLLLIIVPFLPASNFFIRVGFVVAERVLYISSAGYCILVAHGAMLIAQRYPTIRPIILLLFTILLGAFCARTVVRNPVWDTRESLFKSGLTTIPHNAKIHFNYANFLKDSSRNEEAIEHYRTALRLWPEHAVSHNNLGTLLTNLTAAEEHFRAAVHHAPRHYKALFNLGNNLVKQGRKDEAEASFRQSISINPSYTDSLIGLASLLAERGQAVEGRSFMEQAAAIAPTNPDVLSNMGNYLLRIGESREAIEWFQRALGHRPDHHPSLVGMARAYRSRHDNQLAENAYLRALSVREDVNTLHLLAALYHNTGSLEKAAATFQRALSLQPDSVDTVCSYGQTMLQLGRHREIVTLVERSLTTYPQASCLHSVLSRALSKTGSLERALHHSTVAMETVAKGPAHLEALHLHGSLLKDLERLDEAEQTFRRAVELYPDDPTSRLNLGAVLHLTRHLDAARQQYEVAASLDPGNELVLENLKRVNRLQNKGSG